MTRFSQPLALTGAIWFLVSIVVAQQTAPPDEFRWDWRKAQELDWKDNIANSKALSDAARASLVDALASQHHSFSVPWDEEGWQDLRRRIALEASIKKAALTGEGEEDVVVEGHGVIYGGCSPTGNCPFWILRSAADGFVVILHGTAQTFTVQPTRTNGRRDIVLGMHGSATLTELRLYKFNGSTYRVSACYDANWQYLGKDGEYHSLKEPNITSCPN
jgi:hypothetical protein